MYAVDLYLTVFFLVGLWSVGHLLWIFVQKQLPSNKTRAVIAALHDADDVFRFSVEGGLLDAASASGFCYRLLGLHDRADTLCLRAFQATTWWEDLMNMRRGLSYEMTHLIREVRAVRARISAVSYVELQNVQLRTVDGKDIAQLRQEMTHESLAAALPASKSALLAVVATSDFKFGSARQTDEKVIASMAA